MTSNPTFCGLCHSRGLAATHQREVIYETVLSLSGHPSAEDIFAEVRRKIPSISLATVYNNLRTFLDSDMLQEVSLHQKSLRIETNQKPHHHLVCVACKAIFDLDERQIEAVKLRNKPGGFEVKRINVDVLGLCSACSKKNRKRKF